MRVCSLLLGDHKGVIGHKIRATCATKTRIERTAHGSHEIGDVEAKLEITVKENEENDMARGLQALPRTGSAFDNR